VNFSFSAEQDAFRAEARRFLSERVDLRAQIALSGAHDPALWKEMASLGWLGFGIPEEYGGQGSSLVDVCILLEETGRALLPGLLMPHIVASLALARTNTEYHDLLRALASGETVATCAGDLKIPVAGGIVADEVVVLRFMEPAIAHHGTFEAVAAETADLTRPAARITLRDDLEPLLRPVPLLPIASVALAAESVGAAAAALDMAVSYAKERQQFGRPIGSFQAIKHKAADMLRALEAARLTVFYAASAIDAGDGDAHVAAAMAKVAANDAFMRCAAENIQIHGGIGVTWEHDAHLYYRRALASSAMFGESSGGRDLVARALFAELG
jgi:alkylation response protein AidB-like acyl-CoA dehydrogenase